MNVAANGGDPSQNQWNVQVDPGETFHTTNKMSRQSPGVAIILRTRARNGDVFSCRKYCFMGGITEKLTRIVFCNNVGCEKCDDVFDVSAANE